MESPVEEVLDRETSTEANKVQRDKPTEPEVFVVEI